MKLSRITGIYITVAAVLIGGLSILMLNLFSDIAQKTEDIHPFAELCLNNRVLIPLTAVPALLCGIMLIKLRRRTLPLVMLSVVLLLIPFVLVLCCFLMLIAPLYEIQPL